MHLCRVRGQAWTTQRRRAKLRYQGRTQHREARPGRIMVTSRRRSSKILITHGDGQAAAADVFSVERRKSSCILMIRSSKIRRKKLLLQRSNNLSYRFLICGQYLRLYKQRHHLFERTLLLAYECNRNGWIDSTVRNQRQSCLQLSQK